MKHWSEQASINASRGFCLLVSLCASKQEYVRENKARLNHFKHHIQYGEQYDGKEGGGRTSSLQSRLLALNWIEMHLERSEILVGAAPRSESGQWYKSTDERCSTDCWPADLILDPVCITHQIDETDYTRNTKSHYIVNELARAMKTQR